MKIIFSERAWDEYLYWQQQDRKILERINGLIRETLRQPFSGIGKPEPLRHGLTVVLVPTSHLSGIVSFIKCKTVLC